MNSAMTPGQQAIILRNLRNDLQARRAAGATEKQLAGLRDEIARAERGEW